MQQTLPAHDTGAASLYVLVLALHVHQASSCHGEKNLDVSLFDLHELQEHKLLINLQPIKLSEFLQHVQGPRSHGIVAWQKT